MVGIDDLTNIKHAANKRINDEKQRNEENLNLKIDPDPNLQKLMKACDVSGITTHDSTTGHQFNYAEPKIIDRNNNRFILGIMEMIHIKTCPGVNKMTDTQNLHPAYYGHLEKITANKSN
jgi:hypothetical protein